MDSSNDVLNFGEPWAKRLRVTRSRSVMASRGHTPSDQLPSPKPTNPSSTGNIPSDSSSTEHKPRPTQKHIQSLRERLILPPKNPAPIPSSATTQPAKNIPSKPSVAPFFQRIEAAFQDKPAPAPQRSQAPTATRAPARSPSPSADDLIQQLKEHYLQTATTLHTRATRHLAQTHSNLAHRLTHTTAAHDESFLRSTEAHLNSLTRPLSTFRIRSQQRTADGTLRSEEHTVDELVARAEEQVAAFEKDVAGLWGEWLAAEGEVTKLLKGVVAGGDGAGEGEGEEVVRRFREEIEREIAEAEEVVGELGEEAVGVMREMEKDYRKATLPDLHSFFQSIDDL
ncbi:hypothetical protein C8A05DRAFT_16346 [Staphylotrichum tortipilum]|uniref:Uncharacterized protein n=1 Tax=Staphylotrichum tortipilum TaxID=2831512 RepID=A0AAN6MIG1_9PEZI|nr:hypothetical protein C8A05DRAFT_16346 [Staphylotrichum longicolle]